MKFSVAELQSKFLSLNEVCPILVGMVDHEPVINPDEVQAVRWLKWNAFLKSIQRNPQEYSESCIEEARILENTPRCKELLIGKWF